MDASRVKQFLQTKLEFDLDLTGDLFQGQIVFKITRALTCHSVPVFLE